MTALELRNTVILKVQEHLGIPVILSDQTGTEPPYPYVVYTMSTPRSSTCFGDHTLRANDNGITDIRQEQAQAVFSFTVCSRSDDDALTLSDQAAGWFLHTGYEPLMLSGISVVDVMDQNNRSFVQIDETARQYGFDVRLRYVRTDAREVGCIKNSTLRGGFKKE